MADLGICFAIKKLYALQSELAASIMCLEHLSQIERPDWTSAVDPQNLELIMSDISNAIADLKAEATDAVTRVNNDVGSLKQQVADLQAKVDSGGATPQDLQDLAEIKAIVKGIDPTLPDVVPPNLQP